MAIALGPLLGAGLGALQQGKIDKALSGDKVYTKPKTIFGKLIGGISGRTAAMVPIKDICFLFKFLFNV